MFAIKNPQNLKNNTLDLDHGINGTENLIITAGQTCAGWWYVELVGSNIAVMKNMTENVVIIAHYIAPQTSSLPIIIASMILSFVTEQGSNLVDVCNLGNPGGSEGKYFYDSLESPFLSSIATIATGNNTYVVMGFTYIVIGLINPLSYNGTIDMANAGRGMEGFIMQGDSLFWSSIDIGISDGKPLTIIGTPLNNTAFVLTKFPNSNVTISPNQIVPDLGYSIVGLPNSFLGMCVSVGQFNNKTALVIGATGSTVGKFSGGTVTVLLNPQPTTGVLHPFSDIPSFDSDIYNIYGTSSGFILGLKAKVDVLDVPVIAFVQADFDIENASLYVISDLLCLAKPVAPTQLNVVGFPANANYLTVLLDADINNDGNNDLVIGYPDSGNDQGGIVYVMYGPIWQDSINIAEANFIITGPSGARLGSILKLGRIITHNESMPSDLIMGASGALHNCGNKQCRGAAYIFSPSSNCMSGQSIEAEDLNPINDCGKGFRILGPESTASNYIFPASIAVGNINGDGGTAKWIIDDLVFSAISDTDNPPIYIAFGRDSFNQSEYTISELSNHSTGTGFQIDNPYNGTFVSAILITDINQDGSDDILIGIPNYGNPAQPNAGAIFGAFGPLVVDGVCVDCAPSCKTYDPDCGITLPFSSVKNGINIYGNQTNGYFGGTLSTFILSYINNQSQISLLIVESFCSVCSYYANSTLLPNNGTIYMFSLPLPFNVTADNSLSNVPENQICRLLGQPQRFKGEDYDSLASGHLIDMQTGAFNMGVPFYPIESLKGALYQADFDDVCPFNVTSKANFFAIGDDNSQMCYEMSMGSLSRPGDLDVACTVIGGVKVFYSNTN